MRILNVTETYAPFLEFGGAARKGAGACRRPRGEGTRSDGPNGRLGARRTRKNPPKQNWMGTVASRLAVPGKRRRSYLFADVAALPASELEPRGEAVLPGAAGRIRYCAHFWFVRFAGDDGGGGLSKARDSLPSRTDRDVYPYRPEAVA